jgi:hypothetical protein
VVLKNGFTSVNAVVVSSDTKMRKCLNSLKVSSTLSTASSFEHETANKDREKNNTIRDKLIFIFNGLYKLELVFNYSTFIGKSTAASVAPPALVMSPLETPWPFLLGP